MSDLSIATNVGHLFKDKDKEYQVSNLTDDIKARYEQRVFSRVREGARMMKDDFPSREAYSHHLGELNREYAKGHFSFSDAVGQEYLASEWGVVTLLSLCFNISWSEMYDIFINNKEEIAALLKLIYEESYGMKTEDVLPKVVEEPKPEVKHE